MIRNKACPFTPCAYSKVSWNSGSLPFEKWLWRQSYASCLRNTSLSLFFRWFEPLQVGISDAYVFKHCRQISDIPTQSLVSQCVDRIRLSWPGMGSKKTGLRHLRLWSKSIHSEFSTLSLANSFVISWNRTRRSLIGKWKVSGSTIYTSNVCTVFVLVWRHS